MTNRQLSDFARNEALNERISQSFAVDPAEASFSIEGQEQLLKNEEDPRQKFKEHSVLPVELEGRKKVDARMGGNNEATRMD